MAWKPKRPKPSFFCGSPPCPLCYDWHDEEGRRAGLEKFAFDLLGKVWAALTALERIQIESEAARLHAMKLAKDPRISAPLDGVMTFVEATEIKNVEIAVGGVLAAHAKKRSLPAKPGPRALTIDEITEIKERPKPKPKKEKPAPEPAPVPEVSKYRKIAEEIADDLMKNEARAARFESIKEVPEPTRYIMPPPIAQWTDGLGDYDTSMRVSQYAEVMRREAGVLSTAEQKARQQNYDNAQRLGYKILK